MATIGSLVVNVAANAQQFSKGLKDTQRQIDNFKSMVGNASSIVGSRDVFELLNNSVAQAKGIHPAMTAAAEGAQFFLSGMQGSVQQMKELRAEADRFGTTVNTMFELHRTKGGESLIASLGKLQQQLGDAARGSETARKQFDSLGLSWRELVNADAREQLRVVADRIAMAGTASERASIQMDLLGKAGQDALGVLSQGRGGLDAGAAKAHWLLSKEDIENAERFGSSWKKIAAVWEDAWTKLNAIQQTWEDMKTRAFGTPEDVQAMLEARERVAGGNRVPVAIVNPQGAGNMGTRLLGDIAAAADMAAAIKKMNDELDFQYDALSMGADMAKIWHLAWKTEMPLEEFDALKEKLRDVRELQQQIADRGKLGDMIGGMIRSIEGANSPLLQLIEDLEAVGATIEQINAAATVFDLQRKLKEAGGPSFAGLPQALTAGSGEAVSFMNKFNAQQQANANRANDVNQLKDDMQKAVEVLRDILKANKDVAKAVKDQNPIGEQNI